MPELKRLFTLGIMDKDSDERFVKPGSFRDAVNIQISNPSGTNAGTVRPLPGTQLRKNKTYDPSTGLTTEWAADTGSTNYYGLSNTDTYTIGIHKHESTNRIFAFFTSPTVDGILEYDEDTDVVSPVLIDTNSILNFSTDNLITGIQVIDNTLLFAYEDNETKCIDIDVFKAGCTTFTAHTQYYERDFIESDITLLKKGPLTSPTITTSDSLRDGIVTSITNYNFATANLQDGSISASKTPGTIISISLATTTSFLVGDKLTLVSEAPDLDTTLEEYTITLLITAITQSGTSVTAEIVNIPTELEDNIKTWTVTLVESKPLFELEFPRFSYRWKYANNQYSQFAPFSEVIFSPSEFYYNSKRGYNKGMTNNVRKITVSGLDTPPEDVVEVDIVLKKTSNTNVYVVESIDPTDSTFVLTNELIYKLIDSDQLLRPFDAIPKSSKALEISSNRVLLANNKWNYDVETDLSFEKAYVSSSSITEVGIPEPSTKSLRTYQAGIVFKDDLGRETTVFSDKSGVVQTTLEDAATVNSLVFKPLGPAPSFATHFKYFLKETSNEYYNLAADRMYKSEDGTATWISFPSSERNKVTVDSYLIAKKKHDSSAPVTDSDNKYKIVAISNEAPTEISVQKTPILDSYIQFDANFGSGVPQTTKKGGSTPVTGYKTFLIANDQPDSPGDGVSTYLSDSLIAGKYIRFEAGNTSFSKYYKVASIIQHPPGDNELKVVVTEAFGSDIDFLYTDPGSDSSTFKSTNILMKVYEEIEIANQEQFSGRFFVKLNTNTTLENMFTGNTKYVALNAATAYPGGYISNNVNFKIHGGGASPKLGYATAFAAGGLSGPSAPEFANGTGDYVWDILFEKRNGGPVDNTFIAAINTPGTRIRFSNHDTVYTITESRTSPVNHNNASYLRYYTRLDKLLEQTVHPTVTDSPVVVQIIGVENADAYTTADPAIFETEPAEAIDLDIYYEASDAYPISEYNDEKTLSWFNCYSFGNGVESNRIRDDFNAPYIDKGPRGSSVLDEPYVEEHKPNQIIWSGIYNSQSGTNNLNQFIIANPITKDISPIYGSIQKLHSRDTDMVVLCEDKILQVLADKDALYNADGSINVVASNNVLGDARPFVGEFGISTDPASFVSYGFRAYFSDRARGAIIRLSRDGITPISDIGHKDYFDTNLAATTTVIGSYEDERDCYNATLNGETIEFREDAKGWSTRKTFVPEVGVSLNNTYYSFKNGQLWSHDDTVNTNTFYGAAKASSSITLIFNDQPSSVKNFKTINYEGDAGWQATSIETGKQSGRVLTFTEKEGKFYNYIAGVATTWDNTSQSGTLDTKEFSIQGLGDLVSITGDTAASFFTINVYDDPADH